MFDCNYSPKVEHGQIKATNPEGIDARKCTKNVIF